MNTTIMSEIIRVVEDGVEFFTVTETGESGMSQSGLARLCGVSPQAVSKLITETLAGQDQRRRLLTLPGVNARGFLDRPVNLPVDVTTNE